MPNYLQGLKKEVAEIKFLIHDLRVERFINEVIHFHVTLNTDLEIYGVDQAQVLHGEDLQELKDKAVSLRKTRQSYSSAVTNFSPDKTILRAGKEYITTLQQTLELILNPRWGRFDSVLSFLPEDSRSVRSRSHYRNCIRWLFGVHSRIEHFNDELAEKDVQEHFDLADELQDFMRNVVYGYVTEKSGARVELLLERLDPVVVAGNRWRFRRMFFNLVMNAVDAMRDKKLGLLEISDIIEGDRVVLRVQDNGAGMTSEKIAQLLRDKESLDGELHSLGFVFVRQTVAQFGGELSIDSQVGKGTTITIRLPYASGARATPRPLSVWEKNFLEEEASSLVESKRLAKPVAPAIEIDDLNHCGRIIQDDFHGSEAQFPGCIFAMGVTEENRIDYFTHKPYERLWNISHEDLSPTFFEATLRGRLEEDDEKNPVLILKAPQNMREYFQFRDVPEAGRNSEHFIHMVHDEYIRVARKLLETGMPPDIGVLATDLKKLFPADSDLFVREPFALEVLARQKLTTEDAC